MNLTPLMDASPAIQIHVAAALASLVLGGVALFRRKGDRLHRWGGCLWVLLAALTALSSFFLFEMKVIGPFSPIHILSVLVLVSLAQGVRAAMQGRIKRHQRIFQSLYGIAFIVTGLFTLLPGRRMNEVVFGHAEAVTTASGIIANTPVWVWPLLVTLFAVGAISSRPQTKTLPRLVTMPLAFAGLAVGGIATSANPLAALCVVVLAAVPALSAGRRFAQAKGFERVASNALRVPGDWATMGLILTVFATKFGIGAATGVMPELTASPALSAVSSTVSGIAFGFTLGRTLVHVEQLLPAKVRRLETGQGA